MKIRPIRILVLLTAFLVLGACKGQKPPSIQAVQHDAVIPVSRDGEWWQVRHKRFNEIAAAGDIDLVFLGDSITQVWEDAGKAVWEKNYGDRKAANFGISGDHTQHVLWRIENGNFEGISPKLIVLMIGTNNSGSNTPREIADGVIAILDKLQENLPETKVLLLEIFPRGEDKSDGKRKVNREAGAIFKNKADGKLIHYLDIGEVFLEEDGMLPRAIMPDLLHLSEEGYERWAKAIEEKVVELLGE